MLQLIKFGIVGVSNTLISLGVYYVLVYLGVHYIMANIIGFIISVLNAYYWNNRFVFKSTSTNHIKGIIKAFTSYSITFVLSMILLFVMVNYLSISEFVAPIINLTITVPLNFILNKFWAFK